MIITLVGNKLDMESERQVNHEEASQFATLHNLNFAETCAFDLENIETIFITVLEQIMKKQENGELDTENECSGIYFPNNFASGSKKESKIISIDGDSLKVEPIMKKRKECCNIF